MLAPVRFEPIFQSMLWGGNRLPGFVRRPAPTTDPIGEAWMLSDVDGRVSTVSEGPFAGRSLRDILAEFPAEIFGSNVPADGRFPLLFKFLDAAKELSVQVHPDDAQAVALHGPGHRGKTEAWVILDADPRTSQLYARRHLLLRPATTPESPHEKARRLLEILAVTAELDGLTQGLFAGPLSRAQAAAIPLVQSDNLEVKP